MNNQIKSTMTKLVFVAPRLGWTKPLVIVCTCLLLHLTGVAHAAVDDPFDEWALVDIRHLDAQVNDGYLTINIDFNDRLYNPLDYHRKPFIEVFLDSDPNSNTGDYRQGSIAGTDFVIECSVGAITYCILHKLPYDRLHKMESLNFSSIPGASVALLNDRTLTIRLPTNAVYGSSALDVFAVAYLTGNNPALSHKILTGNGDRCPDAGAIDTETGEVVVRHAGAPVNASFSGTVNSGQDKYELSEARFRTDGDQFEITLSFNQTIDLNGFKALQGGLLLDSDRKLNTGQFRMIRPHGLGYEIPSWGGDVSLSFLFDDRETITSLKLSYGTAYYLLPFGSRREQATYPDLELFPFNDGTWHVQGDQLIFRGSLSIFDSYELISDPMSDSRVIIRHATDGRMITRVYTLDEMTGTKDVTPEKGRAFDTGTGQIIEPLMWDPTVMISEQDPSEYGLVWGYDLVRIDTQVMEGNLVVKGVLSLWTDADPYSYFEVLLDTDLDAYTGEFIANEFEPGSPAIGADYKLTVRSGNFGTHIDYRADLFRPDGMIEAHDAFLFAAPDSSDAPEEEDSFTVTIPLASVGHPDQLALFVATRRRCMGLVGDRLDIAPSDPITISSAACCRSDIDGDGDVDGSDLAIFAADFGRTDCDQGQECEGDFDQDVDGSDLAIFAADFGRTDCP